MHSPREIITVICNGVIEAESFCTDLYRFLHLLDDLYDKDQAVTAQDLGIITINVLETFAANPFFQKHIYTLMPAVRTAIVSWVDSENWKNRGGNDKIASHALKSQYHEVFYMVAGIVGGLKHQMHVTRQFREYDWY